METNKNILEFNVPYSGFSNFLKTNRKKMISEILSHMESVIFDNKLNDENIFRINIKKRESDIIPSLILDCKLDINFIENDLQEILDWTLEEEEYELSHRIKLMTDYMNETKFKNDEVS
jgi:hypothetical protein